MTTANKITIVRILLVPFFIVQVLYYIGGNGEEHRLLAILAFALAAVGDGVDGYVARRYHQRSELGAILDPMADKLLLVSGIVLLSLHSHDYLPRLPLYLTVTVLSRDVLLLIGILVLRYLSVTVQVRPHMTGKVATVIQMTCVLWALFKFDESLSLAWLPIFSLGAAVFTGVSGVIYVAEGIRQLAQHPSSSASPTSQTRAGSSVSKDS
jgi:CDP-diacylglycerol--glycerol-3-phosphate 3-phosphatidyltransferase